jgi:hypothetical protein
MLRWTLLAAVSFILAGCATPEAEILTKIETYPATTNVEILLDFPKQSYKTIAILEDRYGGTPEEINARLSRKAGEIGADAIVIVSINDKTVTNWLMIDPYYDARSLRHPHYRPVKQNYRSVRAKAIKFYLK